MPYGLTYIGFTHLEVLIYFQWWSFTSGTWTCFSPLLFGDWACQRLCQMQSENSPPLLLADSLFSSLVIIKQCCLRSSWGDWNSRTGNRGIMILFATHIWFFHSAIVQLPHRDNPLLRLSLSSVLLLDNLSSAWCPSKNDLVIGNRPESVLWGEPVTFHLQRPGAEPF